MHNKMFQALVLRAWTASVCLAGFTSQAVAATDTETRLAAVEAAAKSAQSAGDNAWMLVSAALVLMMTGPGLALFYGAWFAGRMCSAPGCTASS